MGHVKARRTGGPAIVVIPQTTYSSSKASKSSARDSHSQNISTTYLRYSHGYDRLT